MKALNEQGQQLHGRGEGAVGGEEGLHEDGRGVDVVGEPLHQLEEGGALDERHPAALLPLLEHDVGGRVHLGEPEKDQCL